MKLYYEIVQIKCIRLLHPLYQCVHNELNKQCCVGKVERFGCSSCQHEGSRAQLTGQDLTSEIPSETGAMPQQITAAVAGSWRKMVLMGSHIFNRF